MFQKNDYLTLYKNRLQNLAQIIQNLNTVVKQDMALKLMNSTELQKYRIDRINQIVITTLNSEKQQFLIQALIKCQQLQQQLSSAKKLIQNPKNTKNSLGNIKQTYDNIIQEQAQENFELHQQVLFLKKQLQLHNNIIQEANQKHLIQVSKLNEIINKKIQQSVQNSKIFEQEAEMIKKQLGNLKEVKNQLQIKYKQTKEEQKELGKKVKYLYDQNQHLKNQILQINKLKEQTNRTQNIEQLKKHVKILEQKLKFVANGFQIIKQKALKACMLELKNIKKIFFMFKSQIQQQKQQLTINIENSIRIFTNRLQKDRNHIYYSCKNCIIQQGLSEKITEIGDQIDIFIQNHINI